MCRFWLLLGARAKIKIKGLERILGVCACVGVCVDSVRCGVKCVGKGVCGVKL